MMMIIIMNSQDLIRYQQFLIHWLLLTTIFYSFHNILTDQFLFSSNIFQQNIILASHDWLLNEGVENVNSIVNLKVSLFELNSSLSWLMLNVNESDRRWTIMILSRTIKISWTLKLCNWNIIYTVTMTWYQRSVTSWSSLSKRDMDNFSDDW